MAITSKGLIQLGFQDGVDFVLQDNSDGNGVFLVWKSDDAQPSQSDVEAAHIEWQKATGNQAYARSRKAEYDQLNQFEMQFDDDRDSTTTWVDKINEIKGRHPK